MLPIWMFASLFHKFEHMTFKLLEGDLEMTPLLASKRILKKARMNDASNGGGSSEYDFVLWPSDFASSVPSEIWIAHGNAWAVWYDATMETNYLYNPWWSEDIINIVEANTWLDLTTASEMVVQYYFDTAVSSITAWFVNSSSYWWSTAITQTNRERRIYRRTDLRYINRLESQDSAVVLPVQDVQTLYEVRIRAQDDIKLIADFRVVGNEWWSYVYTSADTPYNWAINRFILWTWKGWWTASNVRITQIWINAVAA